MSTDSEDIRQVAKDAGAWCPFIRPAHLAEDHVPSWPVVQHAILQAEKLNSCTYDIIAYMQPTSPLCRPQDISTCITNLITDSKVVSSVAVTEVSCHPFRMKRLLSNGQLVNYMTRF